MEIKFNNRKKIFLFRASSSPIYGAGHMVRSICLADEMSKYFNIFFIIDNDAEIWIKRLRKKNFKYCFLKEEKKVNFLGKINGIFLDLKNQKSSSFKKWKKKYNFLVTISDHGYSNEYANIIINYYSKKNKITNKNLLLYGPKYQILAKKYRKPSEFKIRKEVKRVLISFGMIDSMNKTQDILDILEMNKFSGVVDIVLGSNAKNIEKINKNIKKYNFKSFLMIEKNNLISLYKKSDIVFGAAGVSMLERVILNIPSIVVVTNNDQFRAAKWVASFNGGFVHNHKEKNHKNKLSNSFKKLYFSSKERSIMSKSCKNKIDGLGTIRITREIKNYIRSI